MSQYSERLHEATGLSAEAFVVEALSSGQRLVPEAAARLLAEVKSIHARELAEGLRAWGCDGQKRKEAGYASPFYMYEDADRAADLIDPEVTS
ncbi:hypothetical protein [Streptomyces sp. C3-3]|uniref:hypothetical protein n=1 Tax=Streptomyces sp. C3-3 TaxID=2824901 RepID=UPI001B35E47A|nr:hypothetical protein [Streptomyces sp. C3-3]MBQ1118340.1 hypothetical protein [Streptomyces sp. C3-3]